jgi:hypothetical protein
MVKETRGPCRNRPIRMAGLYYDTQHIEAMLLKDLLRLAFDIRHEYQIPIFASRI